MKAYNKENIPLAKVLRKNMTPWERKLWYNFLRNDPVRFQRQKAIGNDIADFYCAKARLIIELDGVCEYIDHWVQNSLPQSASLTAPSSEGALGAVASKK